MDGGLRWFWDLDYGIPSFAEASEDRYGRHRRLLRWFWDLDYEWVRMETGGFRGVWRERWGTGAFGLGEAVDKSVHPPLAPRDGGRTEVRGPAGAWLGVRWHRLAPDPLPPEH